MISGVSTNKIELECLSLFYVELVPKMFLVYAKLWITFLKN